MRVFISHSRQLMNTPVYLYSIYCNSPDESHCTYITIRRNIYICKFYQGHFCSYRIILLEFTQQIMYGQVSYQKSYRMRLANHCMFFKLKSYNNNATHSWTDLEFEKSRPELLEREPVGWVNTNCLLHVVQPVPCCLNAV